MHKEGIITSNSLHGQETKITLNIEIKINADKGNDVYDDPLVTKLLFENRDIITFLKGLNN